MYTKWWTAAIILLTRIYLSENNGHNNSFNPVLIIFSTDLLKCCKLRNFAPFFYFSPAPSPNGPTTFRLPSYASDWCHQTNGLRVWELSKICISLSAPNCWQDRWQDRGHKPPLLEISEEILQFASIQSDSVALEGSCQSRVYRSVFSGTYWITFIIIIHSKCIILIHILSPSV